MKKIFAIIVLVLIFQSCKNISNNKSYVLDVNIKNIKDSAKVYLYNYENIDFADSTIVLDGKFTFKGMVDYPSSALINIDNRLGFSFWLENDELTLITSENELTSLGYGKRIQNIRGGHINSLSNKYIKFLDKTNKIISSKRKELKVNGYSNNEKRILDSLSKIANDKAYSFFIDNPNNYFSLSNMSVKLRTYSKDSIKTYYNLLSDDLKISSKGTLLSSYIYKNPIIIGEKLIEIKGFDLDGKPMKLSDFKGKTILLNFWAGWCAPCIKKIKQVFPKIRKTYENENFVIVNFSFDYEKSVWKNTSKKLKNISPNFSNLKGFRVNPVKVDYGVYSIPTSFIIDEKGIIIKRLEYNADIEIELKKYSLARNRHKL